MNTADDNITATYPSITDTSGYYTTTIGTGVLNAPTYSTWSAPEYADKKQLEAWLKVLVLRLDLLQERIRQLEGKSGAQ